MFRSKKGSRMYFKILSLLMLGFCSYTDIRYRKIYMKALLLYGGLLLGGRVTDALIYGITNGISDIDKVVQEGFLSALPGCVCLLFSCISKQAFGYGDSFLIIVCGLALGFMTVIQVLLFAFLFSGLSALVLSIVMKKGRKYEMAFIPYLFLGVLLITVAV